MKRLVIFIYNITIMNQIGGFHIKMSPLMLQYISDPDPSKLCTTHCGACAANFMGIFRNDKLFQEFIRVSALPEGLQQDHLISILERYEAWIRKEKSDEIVFDPLEEEEDAAAAAAAATVRKTDPQWVEVQPDLDGWTEANVEQIFVGLDPGYATFGLAYGHRSGHCIIFAKGTLGSFHIIETQTTSAQASSHIGTEAGLVHTSYHPPVLPPSADRSLSEPKSYSGVSTYLNKHLFNRVYIQIDCMKLKSLAPDELFSRDGLLAANQISPGCIQKMCESRTKANAGDIQRSLLSDPEMDMLCDTAAGMVLLGDADMRDADELADEGDAYMRHADELADEGGTAAAADSGGGYAHKYKKYKRKYICTRKI